jgi:lipopolysaccharide transport system ATP-binding protein
MNQAATTDFRSATPPGVSDEQDGDEQDGDDSVNNMAPTAFEQLMAQRDTEVHSSKASVSLDKVDVIFGQHVYRTVKGVMVGLLRGTPKETVTGRKVLDAIDLKVSPGDRLGIVGHNGSGKTTLLKVIAGILPPVHGGRNVVGSIAPVIAQGLGFEPDLPLRLNIKLGLAYSNRLDQHSRDLEDAILEFAELTEFADAQFQTLSSGMQARLTFATSLFQTPDILILDEVFATGDAHFVRKSQAAMMEHIERTPIVILVSHSAGLIREVCNRSILLDHGRMVEDGPTDAILDIYARRYG